MLKKIFFGSLITVVTTGAAVADPAPYVGASFGLTVNTANVKFLQNPNNNSVNFAGGAYRGIPFSVFAGYGGVIGQNFYMAGEVFGTIATANISDDRGMKTSYGYGVSILPGFVLADRTIGFVRLGVIRSRFPREDVSTTGGQVGVGFQTCLTQNIDVRGEYDYVSYRSIDKVFIRRTGTQSLPIAPRSDQVSIGLVYKFD